MPSRSPGPSRAPEHKTFIFSTHHPASSTVASESDSEESSRSTLTGGAAANGAPAAPRVRLARDGFAVATAPRC